MRICLTFEQLQRHSEIMENDSILVFSTHPNNITPFPSCDLTKLASEQVVKSVGPKQILK